jgi:hypothetical protein
MVSEIKNKISQSNSLIDESFDVKKTSEYQLVLQIGTDGVLIAVNDKSKNKYIAFEKYTFQNIYSFTPISELLDILVKDSKLIPHTYKWVNCLVVNNLSTIVPNPLFENENKEQYLNFNVAVNENDVVLSDDLKNLDAKNIFALPLSLKIKLDALYGKVSYHHFSSTLLDNLLFENKNQNEKKVYVHVQATHFEIVYIEGKKLFFYNTFNHHSAEDFIYYLLFSCEQLQLNPENIEIILLGEIEKNSALYAIAQKYIRNIRWGERKSNVDYSYQLQSLPKHYYFTLFSDFTV